MLPEPPRSPDYLARPPLFARLPGWTLALAVLVVGFLVYQAATGIFLIGALLAAEPGVAKAASTADGLAEAMTRHPKWVLAANAGGQVFGLGTVALGFAVLTAGRRWPRWLRLRSEVDRLETRRLGRDIGWSVLGWVGLIPIVGWLGTLNERVPLPESIRAMEAAQAELLERVLSAELGLMVPLLTVALVPALFEELFFRGAAQRAMERSVGGLGAAVVIGVAFGLYHLRLSQALPLALLGVYLGYLTWRTGSLWPAVVVHFVNNGAAILGGALDAPGGSGAVVETPPTSLLEGTAFVIGGAILAALVVARLERSREVRTLTASDALDAPGSTAPSPTPSSSTNTRITP